jgi:hypothetical protein
MAKSVRNDSSLTVSEKVSSNQRQGLARTLVRLA